MYRVLLGTLALLALSLGRASAAQEEKEKAAGSATQRRPGDIVYILIEMSDVDTDSVAELQRVYDVLRKLDKNKDGKIDPDELKVVRRQLTDDRVERIFTKLDTDQNGKISKEEAKGRILEHFDRLDRNTDGSIDRAELRQAITVHPVANNETPADKAATSPK